MNVWIGARPIFNLIKRPFGSKATISYVAFSAHAERCRHAAGQHGCRPWRQIAFLGLNSPVMPVLMFACAHRCCSGAVELASGTARTSLYPEYPGPRYCSAKANSPKELRYCGRSAGLPDGFDGKRLRRTVDRGRHDALNPDAGAATLLIVYTSGTTGRPKEAVSPRTR